VLHVRKSQRPVTGKIGYSYGVLVFLSDVCISSARLAGRARASRTGCRPAVITSLLTHQDVGLPAC
jgi:hypothetical protein